MSYGDDEAVAELFFRAVGLQVPFAWEEFITFRSALEPSGVGSWFEGPVEGAVLDEWGLSKQVREGLGEIHRRGWESLRDEARRWPGRVILQDERDYPEGLRELKEAPVALHVMGAEEGLRQAGLGVVGSRKITAPDARLGRRLVQEVARQGAVIVSGGALGADGVAHRAAVDLQRPTVAVLPAGLDRPTPASHRELFRSILETGGTLVSEYAPGTEVRKYHFRRRNGLIAAMSRCVLVLRARQGSGSMLTVEAARLLGRPCAAIPGHPDDPESQGCLAMLREGATMVASREDLLAFWGEVAGQAAQRETKTVEEESPERCPVLDKARGIIDEAGQFSLEALGVATELEASELQVRLLHHELSGRVERVAAGYRLRG